MLSLNSDLICCFYLLNLPPLLVVLSMRSCKSLLTNGTWSSFLPPITFPLQWADSLMPLAMDDRRQWGIPLHSASHKHLSWDFFSVIGLVLGHFVASSGHLFPLKFDKHFSGSRCNSCWVVVLSRQWLSENYKENILTWALYSVNIFLAML